MPHDCLSGTIVFFPPISYHQTKKKTPVVKISEIARAIPMGASMSPVQCNAKVS